MHPFLLKQLFTDEILRAFCWTLIHSLWQGLLLAIIAGVFMILTKRSSSFLRYNLFSVLFFSFIVITCFSFVRQLQIEKTKNEREIYSQPYSFVSSETTSLPAADISSSQTVWQNYMSRFSLYFNEHASLVVTIWFIIFSARLLQMMGNLGYSNRLKTFKTHFPSIFWQKKINELSDRLGIKKRIVLLESEIVKVPMMTGLWKPVILFPISLLSQLPPEEVEAILLHELAHIKRKDYFINLLQHFGEIIFFFNPAVLWLSSLIRDERENCCDDIAIRETNNKENFVHALVVFQEYNLSYSKQALAFPGQKNHLLNRVKRIITNKNKTLNNMEKILLSTGIVLIGFFTATFSQSTQAIPKTEKKETSQAAAKPEPAISAKEATDSVPPKKETNKSESKTYSSMSHDGKDIKIVEVGGKITELYVDGKKIPDDKISEYEPVIAEERKAQKERMEQMNEQLKAQKEELEIRQKQMILKAEELQNEQRERVEFNKKVLENLEKQEIEMKMENEKNANKVYQLELNRKQEELQNMMLKLKLESAINTDVNKEFDRQKQLELQNITLKLKSEIAMKDAIEANQMNLYSQPVLALSATPMKLNQPLASVIQSLKSENLIKNEDNLSFTLDKDKLIVNGIKQPAEVHQKFKQTYIKSPKDHIIYSGTKKSSRTDVYIE